MDCEFRNIQILIRKAIATAKGSKKAAGVQFNQIKSSISTEGIRIKTSFPLKVLSIENVKQGEHFVRYHQQSVIEMLNELFEAGKREGKRKPSNTFEHLEQITEVLEDVLHFLQITFRHQFDFDSEVPHFIKDRVLAAIKESSDRLESSFINYSVEEDLRITCLSVLSNFSKIDDKRTTFRAVACIKGFVKQLHELTANSPAHSSIDNQIRNIFLAVNCDDSTCFSYYVQFLTKEISKAETASDKLECLAFHYKTVNQVAQEQNLKFSMELPSVKTRVSEWLVEEIAYYEKMRELTLTPSSKSEGPIGRDFKVIFDLSVSQFAYFIRVLIETGVIQNKNLSELIRFLVKFVKTKRSENISYESFRMKYYNVESNTKGAVSNLLHTSIGHINSN